MKVLRCPLCKVEVALYTVNRQHQGDCDIWVFELTPVEESAERYIEGGIVHWKTGELFATTAKEAHKKAVRDSIVCPNCGGLVMPWGIGTCVDARVGAKVEFRLELLC